MSILVSHRARRARSSQIRQLLKLTRREDVLSLAGGLPAAATFATDAVRGAVAAVLDETGPWGPPALQYGPTEGDPGLRELLAAEHGVAVERVLITTGSQQALSLLAEVLADPGDSVAVAEHTYLGAIQAFDRAGLELVPVAADGDGLRPDRLAARVAAHGRCRVVYLVPDFANPTGAVASSERRRELVALVERHGLVVIEDRPYHELRFDGPSLPALGEMTDRAIRVGTVSKVLAPGLRVGWMVAPVEVVTAATRLKQAIDLHTSSLDQMVVARLLADRRWYAGQVDAIRRHYRDQADALGHALDAHLAGRFSFERPRGGMFVWGRFDDDVDARAVLRRALEAGVAFVPGAEFAAGDPQRSRPFARLSFATLPIDRFGEAARRLAVALDATRSAARRPSGPVRLGPSVGR